MKVEKMKRDADDTRVKAENHSATCQNLVMPTYVHDSVMDVDREDNPPSRELFIGLGWDEDKDTNRKHYRRFHADELENVKSVLPRESPFN